MRPTPAAGSRAEQVGSLVQEFYEERGKEAAEAKAAARPRHNRPLFTILVAVLCVIVWALPYMVEITPPPVSEQVIEDGTRVTMYLASLDVSRFRAANGRLPTVLSEAGVDHDGLAYNRTSDSTYDIVAHVNGHDVTFHSTMARNEFLGSASALLERK
jgi:hypothetical protein